MKLKDAPASGVSVVHGELSGHEIRAITSRLAHPDHPLTPWRVEFEEWRKAYSEFLRIEKERLFEVESPSPVTLRQHRYLLFLLMARGEQLALAVMADSVLGESERRKLVEQADSFLRCLRDSWQTWHGEVMPAHREMLAKFLD